MILPMLIDISNGHPNGPVFGLSMLISAVIGIGLILSSFDQEIIIGTREAFLLTGTSWFILALFSAVPFMLADTDLSVTDGFFEAMSGITTTGSTIFTDVEGLSQGILFWRSFLQFLGGVGFIVLALSVLPFLRVGGMQLFQSESSENEKLLPRVTTLATQIGGVYIGIAVACTTAYLMAGMSAFDAINHMMTTIATGGFSTYNSSMGQFDHVGVEVSAILFMAASAMPFVLYLKIVRGDWQSVLRDQQIRGLLKTLTVFSAIIFIYALFNTDLGVGDALRQSAFNTVSVITGTGYATTDYSLWGSFVATTMLFLTFVGGCAGSASCGIKIFRFQILFSIIGTQLKRLLYPHGVFQPMFNDRPVKDNVSIAVIAFFVTYLLTFIVVATGLAAMDLDLITAVSGAATTLSNVGPGLGDMVGPAGNFAGLPAAGKWLTSIAMVLGRLEFFTVLILLTPQFWQD